MKKTSIILIAIIAILSVLPISYVVASASCTGTPPVCSLADAFSFVDGPLTVFTGKLFSFADTFHLIETSPILLLGNAFPFSDAFHFLDSKVTAVVSIGGNNVFTQTTTNNQNILYATSTLEGQLLTEIIFPLTFLIGIIALASRMGIREENFPILLGLVVFAFGGLIYGKILPTWLVIFPILFGGAAVALLVSKFLGARGSGDAG